MSLTSAIKNEAHRLGFAMVGVTTPDPPPHLNAFQNWLASGRHGTMSYLNDPRRADPRLVMPQCRSIVILAVQYPDPNLNNTPLQTSEKLPGQKHGYVAGYARGSDYHNVIPERVHHLVTYIESQIGKTLKYRFYTDTGPLLERDLAQRAGLGWIGKNTCLINPRLGSYFLLAEILLDLELESDLPFDSDHCGTCSRCIEACPTGCILSDRMIDARICLSYLTIENKKEIPINLRKKLGNRVFGCDICQQVCPWNRFAGNEFDPAFRGQGDISSPILVDDLALTPQEFNTKFKTNPVLRSKRRGYLRNIAVAIGNSGDPDAIPALQKAIGDEETLIREHAVWAMEQIQKSGTALE
jgi:epoxyqueuosine reductase